MQSLIKDKNNYSEDLFEEKFEIKISVTIFAYVKTLSEVIQNQSQQSRVQQILKQVNSDSDSSNYKK